MARDQLVADPARSHLQPPARAPQLELRTRRNWDPSRIARTLARRSGAGDRGDGRGADARAARGGQRAGRSVVSQQRALESLRRDGLAIVPFSDLIGDDELWAELAEDASDFASSAEQ